MQGAVAEMKPSEVTLNMPSLSQQTCLKTDRRACACVCKQDVCVEPVSPKFILNFEMSDCVQIHLKTDPKIAALICAVSLYCNHNQ